MDNNVTDQHANTSGNHTTQDGLQNIRNRALEALGPMAENLQETPERKFDILMTAARLSDDNTTMLDKALQVALTMEDGTPKAEALIDIVNEATYRIEHKQQATQGDSASD